ncbi:MAG: cupredoxin domain-containing protein [Candidatus Nomurabacteria bacterium]
MKKNKNTIIAIIIALALIIIAIFSRQGGNNNKERFLPEPSKNSPVSNNSGSGSITIKVTDDKGIVKADNPNTQIIEIQAKGGYTPRKSIAKAGVPTILRFNTNGTFDCSSSVRIPSMNIFKSLPQSGTTDIDLGTQKTGVLQGMCGMGMYPFEIDFQ